MIPFSRRAGPGLAPEVRRRSQPAVLALWGRSSLADTPLPRSRPRLAVRVTCSRPARRPRASQRRGGSARVGCGGCAFGSPRRGTVQEAASEPRVWPSSLGSVFPPVRTRLRYFLGWASRKVTPVRRVSWSGPIPQAGLRGALGVDSPAPPLALLPSPDRRPSGPVWVFAPGAACARPSRCPRTRAHAAGADQVSSRSQV